MFRELFDLSNACKELCSHNTCLLSNGLIGKYNSHRIFQAALRKAGLHLSLCTLWADFGATSLDAVLPMRATDVSQVRATVPSATDQSLSMFARLYFTFILPIKWPDELSNAHQMRLWRPIGMPHLPVQRATMLGL